jgi:hypothetical protein
MVQCHHGSFICTQVERLSEKERDSVLVLDEMALAERVEFDIASGSMMGNVSLPKHTGKANHALVFMLVGQY